MQKKSPAKQYTYTVSESRQSKKQQRKVPKEKVLITKSKLKKEYKDQTSAWLPTSAYDVKKKEVTQKRANRKTSRKSGKWIQPIAGSKSIAQQKFPEIKEKNQGKFTAWAKKNGFKDACSAASAVMKSKKKYKPAVVKMANYAKNFGCSTAKSPAKQKGYIKDSKTGKGVMYDEKTEGKTLRGGRKHQYYKDGKKVATAKSNKTKSKVRVNSPAKQTDKKIKKMEERTKRIGIRQGERTRRVEARNKK